MADINKFGSGQPFETPGSAICAQCEAMLPDAIDGILSPEEQADFDRHLSTCADCSRMYIDAKRGAEWLLRLKTPQPEPTAALLERILRTTGPATGMDAALPIASAAEPNTLLGRPMLVPAAASPAVYAAGNVLPFPQRVTNAFRLQALRHTFMQPRLAMTAAMAFFSIALTLNLTGIHITQLRASDLKPSSIKRSFYDANARVARSIDNLRVVYELESRVQDLQRNDDSTTGNSSSSSPDRNAPSGNQNQDQKQDQQNSPGQKNQQKQNAPRPRSGSSRSIAPRPQLQYTASDRLTDRPVSSPGNAFFTEQLSLLRTPNVFQFKNHQQGGQA